MVMLCSGGMVVTVVDVRKQGADNCVVGECWGQ